MPDNDKILTVAHEWTAKAENDLKNAAHTLKLGRGTVLLIPFVFTHSNAPRNTLKLFLFLRKLNFLKRTI